MQLAKKITWFTDLFFRTLEVVIVTTSVATATLENLVICRQRWRNTCQVKGQVPQDPSHWPSPAIATVQFEALPICRSSNQIVQVDRTTRMKFNLEWGEIWSHRIGLKRLASNSRRFEGNDMARDHGDGCKPGEWISAVASNCEVPNWKMWISDDQWTYCNVFRHFNARPKNYLDLELLHLWWLDQATWRLRTGIQTVMVLIGFWWSESSMYRASRISIELAAIICVKIPYTMPARKLSKRCFDLWEPHGRVCEAIKLLMVNCL